MGHDALPIEYVTYQNELDPEPTRFTEKWEDLAAALMDHERTTCDPCPGGKKCKAKFGMAISPGVPREGTERADENIEFVSFLMLDFDHLTQKESEGVSDRLEGLELVAHSTHSHRHGISASEDGKTPARPPEEDICFRVALPYPRPLKPAEHKKVRRAFIEKYKLEWKRPDGTKAGADPTRKDLSGIYFFPSAPKRIKDDELIANRQDGALIDLDELLKAAPRTSAHVTTAFDAPASSPSLPPGPVDIEAICKSLRAYNPRRRPEDEGEPISKKELVRRVLACEALVKPEEKGQRDHSCNRIGFILGRNFPSIADRDVLLHLVDLSVKKLPVYDDDDPSPEKDGIEGRFAKVVRGWENGRAAAKEQKKEREERKNARSNASKQWREKMNARSARAGGERASPAASTEPGPVPDEDLDEDPGEDPGEESDVDEFAGWEGELLRSKNKDGEESGLVGAESNANTVLRFSPEWRNVIRFNLVTKKVLFVGGPLEDYERGESTTTSGVHYWFQKSPEWRLLLKKHEIQDAIFHTAKANAFDPLKKYLESLKWDGVKRIDTFLETYCGAEMTDPAGNDISEHVRRIGRRWLIAAVARALEPGCKMDTILMMEGEQGVKKSTFIRALAVNEEWFTDSPISIAEKDGKMLAAKKWIVELAELSALRASDVEAQKAFFSTRYDEFRPPYAREVEAFPRRCVYVGSTNDDKYLLDPTGNRRSWVVKCKGFKVPKVEKDRGQLWAEAVHYYKAGLTCPKCQAAASNTESATEDIRCADHRWWLSMTENEVSESSNNQRLRSGYTDLIRAWFLDIAREDRPEEVTVRMMAKEALELQVDKFESQQRAIGIALKSLGFDKKQRRVPGGSEYYYLTPEELMLAPKREAGKGKGNVHAVPKLVK
jgi:hypothetical protein